MAMLISRATTIPVMELMDLPRAELTTWAKAVQLVNEYDDDKWDGSLDED